jgi:hypothetical protein
VKGTVIDVSSSKPVANILVTQQYNNDGVASAVSDNEGKFTIAAYSEVQGRMLTVGHSLMNYSLIISSSSSASSSAQPSKITHQHLYKASKVMFGEEILNDEVVFFDSEPSVIAPPPNEKYKTTQQWYQAIKSELFSACNIRLGEVAINQLAIARKLFTHSNSNYIGLAYYQVRLASDGYFDSCKSGAILNQALLKNMKQMYDEISSYEIHHEPTFLHR